MRSFVVAVALVVGLGSSGAMAAIGAGAQFGGASLGDAADLMPASVSGDDSASFAAQWAKPVDLAGRADTRPDDDDVATGSLAAPGEGRDDGADMSGKPTASRTPDESAVEERTASLGRGSEATGKPMAIRKPIGEDEGEDVAYGEERSGKPGADEDAE